MLRRPIEIIRLISSHARAVSLSRSFRIARVQGLSEACQIFRVHANDAATRAVNVRYQRERDGDDQRQNQKQHGSSSAATRTITDQ